MPSRRSAATGWPYEALKSTSCESEVDDGEWKEWRLGGGFSDEHAFTNLQTVQTFHLTSAASQAAVHCLLHGARS